MSFKTINIFTETDKELSIDNSLDISSDLHIDQWDKKYKMSYPCGQIKDSPLSFPQTKNKILIVAGDVSDDLDISLKYLDELSQFYDRILFVDGNHEHVSAYPHLYTDNEIQKRVKALKNEKIIFLPKTHYVNGDTVVFGVCGWWDYNKRESKSIKESENYFDEWIPEISNSKGGSKKFVDLVIKRCEQQHKYLRHFLDKYQKDPKIKKIIVVTHTTPLPEFSLETDGSLSTAYQLQSKSELFVDGSYPKLKYWIFGHTHTQFEVPTHHVKFIAHPRGRPEDFNRLNYLVKSYKLK